MPAELIFETIFSAVRQIPRGRVMSYGQVARECGATARTVGWAMAEAPSDVDVPWQRVVGADGYLRIGRRSVPLQELQRALLESEGVEFLANGCVDMRRFGPGEPTDASGNHAYGTDGSTTGKAGHRD